MDNQNIEKYIQKIGLTELETKVYLYILKNGPIKATNIYKDLKADKSSTYRVVENLIQMQLVISLGEKYGQEFTANDPSVLIELSNNKENEIKVASHKISEFFENLPEKLAEKYKYHNISVFEGPESYKKTMEKRLETNSKLIREIANPDIPIPDYWEYIDGFIARRVKAGIFVKSLIHVKNKDEKYEQSDEKILKNVRLMPSGFTNRGLVATFGPYTTFNNLHGKRLLGIIIKDQIITEVINNMFDMIWEISKEN